jgi:hypothetical protein
MAIHDTAVSVASWASHDAAARLHQLDHASWQSWACAQPAGAMLKT